MARYDREAKLLASVIIPGLASIHAIQHHNRKPSLISELVEGQTQQERLRRGALPAA